MQKPFHEIWEKTTFRNADGWKLVVDDNTVLFVTPGYKRVGEPAPRDYRWELMLGKNRKVVQRGYVMTDGADEAAGLERAARHAIQKSLTYLHGLAVQLSYAATNMRILTGVPDESLEDGNEN